MPTGRLYQKYPEAIRQQVIKSKDPYLFPENKIPRTTALYWINNSRVSDFTAVTEDSLSQTKIRSLELELERAKALRTLVEKVRLVFPHQFNDKRVTKVKV